MTTAIIGALSLSLMLVIHAASAAEVPLIVTNTGSSDAQAAPVSAGIPFKRGALHDPSSLALEAAGEAVPLQAACLSRWPDGSCRWVLCDFRTDAAAGASAEYTLKENGENPAPANPVTVAEDGSSLTLSNGIVEYTAEIGGAGGFLASADGRASAEITSTVEIGPADRRITSRVVIDSMEVYARGPVRAAAALYGRRIYTDGIEGPFSQRVEMFAGSPWLRVEDTFVYAHVPGTHGEPENPLALWQIEAKPSGDASRLAVESLVYDEESEGLVIDGNRVAFYGRDEPFNLARWTDEELVGEDTPGIALGVAKSCAVAVGLCKGTDETGKPLRDLFACTTPRQYAASKALGDFAPLTPGKYQTVEEGMRRMLGFWMWFQDNDPDGVFDRGPWHGLFDWGDWQSRYADRKHQPTGWNYHEGRYGWDCNEMDTTLGLWSAFFHTGRGAYWRAAVAMSRHVMDVDMIHVDYRKYDLPEYVYDPHVYCKEGGWREGRDRLMGINTIGLGRRHNVQHWGNGVGDTRHTWNGGLMMYYYLTGNRRAYDAVVAAAEMHMQHFFGVACGEYAVSMWCLYNAWQMTGCPRYHDEFLYRLSLVDKFVRPDGSIPGHLDLVKAEDYGTTSKGYGAYLDLTLDYISNALIDYYADTGDPRARRILLGLAERNLQDEPRGPADYARTDALRLFSWAYLETKDERFLERAKYHLSSLELAPLEKEPASPDEWRDALWDVLAPHDWDIRVVGPVMRMAPYAMYAVDEAEKD